MGDYSHSLIFLCKCYMRLFYEYINKDYKKSFVPLPPQIKTNYNIYLQYEENEYENRQHDNGSIHVDDIA